MNLLSPWFLLGALAIAGPLLFHLIRQTARERIPFSSLMFLRPMPPRVTRRRKLEDILLLLLRCLALLLLAFGFARPFFSKATLTPAAASEGSRRILLVDTSASIRRDGAWENARRIVDAHLAKAAPGDELALLAFARQPRTLVSFSDWSGWTPDQRAALVRERLATISPGWLGTQLGLALTSAAEQLTHASRDKPAAHREIILITDLQEGARLDGLQGHDWPADVKVIIETVQPRRAANAGLAIASELRTKLEKETDVRVRVTNARNSNQEKFTLAWTDQSGNAHSEPMELYLPPGQSRTLSAPKISATNFAGQLRLSGDEETFDNAAYYVASETERVIIAWLGAESGNDPQKLRYYFERVFPTNANRHVQLVRPAGNSGFARDSLNQSALAVITERLSPEEIAATREWLARGKTALLVLSDVHMGATLSALAELPEIQITEARGNFGLLGEVDFTHPLFAPFADPRFSDFTPIHFWKYRRWEIPTATSARVLARFDDGSPALAQLAVDQGSLLVLASGWHPADSQFAVSSKFPPFMHTLLDWSGGGAAPRAQFLTGDAIPAPGIAGVSPQSPETVQWQKPDGKTVSLSAGTAFIETDLPGIYTATFGNTRRHFAVNIPFDESRTAPLTIDEIARLGVPLEGERPMAAAKAAVQQRHLERAELENQQKLWRWLVVAVLVFVLGETILSGRLARQVKTVEVVS